jgi:hypothetical protein
VNSHKRIYLLFVGLAVIYLIINLAIPPSADTLNRFSVTTGQVKMLKLIILLPYIAIWFAAFYGSLQLRDYVEVIKKSRDGNSLSKIAAGLMIFAIAMPTIAILSSIVNYLGAGSAQALKVSTIIVNYVDTVLGLFAMYNIYRGSQSLTGILSRKVNASFEHIFMAAFIALSTIFIYLTLSNPARQFPVSASGHAAYYLPDFLLIPTIILPYLIIWYFGFRSAHYVQIYRQNVKGKVYRSSLGYLASGLLLVVFARISIRFTTSLSTLFDNLSLRYILIVIYLLLLIISAGFIVIAIGSRKLKKIEEV